MRELSIPSNSESLGQRRGLLAADDSLSLWCRECTTVDVCVPYDTSVEESVSGPFLRFCLISVQDFIILAVGICCGQELCCRL